MCYYYYIKGRSLSNATCVLITLIYALSLLCINTCGQDIEDTFFLDKFDDILSHLIHRICTVQKNAILTDIIAMFSDYFYDCLFSLLLQFCD